MQGGEGGRSIWTGLPQLDNPYGPSKNTANTALYGTQGVFWRYGKG